MTPTVQKKTQKQAEGPSWTAWKTEPLLQCLYESVHSVVSGANVRLHTHTYLKLRLTLCDRS